MKIEKYVPLVSLLGLVGLLTSLYLLLDFSEPLYNIFSDFLKQFG